MDAALAQFADHGYRGATVRDIARTVGVRESAFYLYFASKQALYDELLAANGPSVVVRAAQAIREENAAAAIRNLVASAMDDWTSPRARAFASVFLRDAFTGEAPGGRAVLSGIETAIQAVAKHFRRWKRAGQLHGDFPEEHLAWELIAPLNIARFLYFNAASTKADRQHGAELVKRHTEYFLARHL